MFDDDPAADVGRVDAELEDPVIQADEPVGPGQQRQRREHSEDDECRPEHARGRPQVPPLDDQSRDDERGRKEDVLDPGQRCDDGKDEEHRLRPRGRPLEGDDAGQDCAQRQGHAEGVGGDVGAEDERGKSNRGRRGEKSVAERQGEPAPEEVDRNRCQ